jgi:hypothetical protein
MSPGHSRQPQVLVKTYSVQRITPNTENQVQTYKDNMSQIGESQRSYTEPEH